MFFSSIERIARALGNVTERLIVDDMFFYLRSNDVDQGTATDINSICGSGDTLPIDPKNTVAVGESGRKLVWSVSRYQTLQCTFEVRAPAGGLLVLRLIEIIDHLRICNRACVGLRTPHLLDTLRSPGCDQIGNTLLADCKNSVNNNLVLRVPSGPGTAMARSKLG